MLNCDYKKRIKKLSDALVIKWGFTSVGWYYFTQLLCAINLSTFVALGAL